MAKGKIAPITGASVGRHRILGRDQDGVNIEEKVCPIRGEVFMDREGNYMHIPLENGRIPSPEGARAGQVTREEGIKLQSWLPLAECPFTSRYHHLVKGPLIAPGEGEKDCGGKPEGCEHWWKIQKARVAKSKAAAAERNRPHDNAGLGAIEKLGKSIAAWSDAQMASAPAVKEARARLRDGKGEGAHG